MITIGLMISRRGTISLSLFLSHAHTFGFYFSLSQTLSNPFTPLKTHVRPAKRSKGIFLPSSRESKGQAKSKRLRSYLCSIIFTGRAARERSISVINTTYQFLRGLENRDIVEKKKQKKTPTLINNY